MGFHLRIEILGSYHHYRISPCRGIHHDKAAGGVDIDDVDKRLSGRQQSVIMFDRMDMFFFFPKLPAAWTHCLSKKFVLESFSSISTLLCFVSVDFVIQIDALCN
jgi:hypothetical protein